jgi:D-alanyl-D-alanine carboxypeptidase
MSYPKGEDGALFSDATCFHYEPWHYRYVGREIARKIHRSGLTIREYLWKHHTQLTADLQPVATPTPTPSPSARPTVEPSPTAVPPADSVTPQPSGTDAPEAPSPSQTLFGLDPPVVVAIGIALALLILIPVVLLGRRAMQRS